jgi:hypothetical protein
MCPDNSVSFAGSANLDDCFCAAGHAGQPGGPCERCPAGKYTAPYEYSLWRECQDCPPHSSTVSSGSSASASASPCLCNRGYTGPNGGSCRSCESGFYKSSMGSSMCLLCPESSLSVPGEAFCRCQTGTYKLEKATDSGSICDECPRGKYSSTEGAESCTLCPGALQTTHQPGSFSPSQCVCTEGAYSVAFNNILECRACPAYSMSAPNSTSIQDCKCLPGFEGPDGGECFACLTGKFKGSTGNGPCQSCPNLFTSTSREGSTSPSDCQCIKLTPSVSVLPNWGHRRNT